MSQNRTYNFGVGRIFATNELNPKENLELMTVQSVNINFNGEVKELHGNLALPVSSAVAKMSVSGTINIAAVNQDAVAKYLWGTGFSDGSVEQFTENKTVPNVSPYTITVQDPSDLIDILVVFNQETGEQLKRVDTVAAAGEYSVSLITGVLTFHEDDADLLVQILGKKVVLNGRSYDMQNYIMGSNKPFQLEVWNEFQGTKQGLILYNVLLSSWAENFTNDDYGVPNCNFSAFSNAAGLLGKRYFSQKV